ncbi:MAG: hypothetical protein HQ546_08570, partial [Planctomycetes bacterium]|nr:hypothetical protein [Planctomycetota bacterium]
MVKARNSAKINVKALLIFLIVLVMLTVAVAAAWHGRRWVVIKQALVDGKQAFARADWVAATKHYRRYLERNPDDMDILQKYAEANMRISPLEIDHLRDANGAYRQLIRLNPDDGHAYEQLARIYIGARNFLELTHLANQRLARRPGDAQATIWLGQGLIAQEKEEPARQAGLALQELLTSLDAQQAKDEVYTDACWLLSRVALQTDPGGAKAKALTAKVWIDRAVEYNDHSAAALINRTQFLAANYKQLDLTEQSMQAAIAADLERADALAPQGPRLRLALGEQWFFLGRYDRVEAELAGFAEIDQATVRRDFLDPDDCRTLWYLQTARLAIQRGTASQSVKLADEIIATIQGPRHRPAILQQSIQLYASAKHGEQARRCLEEYLEGLRQKQAVLDSDPKIADLRTLVLRVENRPDKWQQIIGVLQPLTAGGQPSAHLQKLLAEAYIRTGQTNLASMELTACLNAHPDDKEEAKLLVRELRKQRKWNLVLTTVQALEADEPDNLDITLVRIEAAIYVAASKPSTSTAAELEKLSQELAALKAAHPSRANIRIIMSAIALNQDKAAEAEALLTAAVAECEAPLEAKMQLARLLARPGIDRLGESIEICRAATVDHAESDLPWQELAQLLEADKKPDQAGAALQDGIQAAQTAGARQRLRTQLALLNLRSGNRAEGLGILRELAQNDPDNLVVRSLLLETPEVLQDPIEAQRLIDELRKTQGESGLLRQFHQASLLMTGDDWRQRQQEIIDSLNICLQAAPGWTAPALLLARLSERLGDLPRVESIYRAALKANPGEIVMANKLADL